MNESISERIARIRQTLPQNVRLVAVSKYVSTTEIQAAYDAGIRDFGESKIQDLAAKQAELSDLPDITWHLIGHLQSNKAKKALEFCDWIHSVDSLKLAQRLNRLAAELSVTPQVFLQVKMLPDPNKFGWEVSELIADLPLLNDCTHLKFKGLMAIAPLGLDDSQTLDLFTKTRQLCNQITQQQWSHMALEDLSMGMSGDYLLAVKAGATVVRLGQILFG